jgi:hypothetical protein
MVIKVEMGGRKSEYENSAFSVTTIPYASLKIVSKRWELK